MHSRRVVKRVHGAPDKTHGKLCAAPAEQRAEHAAKKSEQRGFEQPHAADDFFGDAERAQHADFLAPPDDRAVETLKN